MRPCLLMSKPIELRCADFIETLAVIEVFGSLREVVAGRRGFRDARQDFILSFSNHRRQQIVWHDNTRLIVDVETKIHVWKVCDKVLHHAGRGLLLPLITITNRHHFAIPYGYSNQSTIFVAYSVLNARSYCFWLERPERQQHLIDHVKLVNHDNIAALCKLEPFVEVRRWRYAVSAPVFADGLV